MAQLRDSQTSALLYEGTPAQVAAIAAAGDADDFLFDDVGLDFDPASALEQTETNIDYLREVDADQADADQALLDEARNFDVESALAAARAG